MLPIRHVLPVKMLPQPDETTCGPTCLHAIYRYWGMQEPLEVVIERTRKLEDGGGTFAVFLVCDALRRGYRATIYTYNLTVFDPTWFAPGVDIAERLRRQGEFKHERRLQHATEGYLEFLALGGRLRFVDLTRTLIRGLLRRGLPILTGLSSTYLYRTAREFGPQDTPDDIRGTPSGHFVVLAGYDRRERTVLVADPYGPHPYGPTHEYWMGSTASWAPSCWASSRTTPICSCCSPPRGKAWPSSSSWRIRATGRSTPRVCVVAARAYLTDPA